MPVIMEHITALRRDPDPSPSKLLIGCLSPLCQSAVNDVTLLNKQSDYQRDSGFSRPELNMLFNNWGLIIPVHHITL